VLNGGTDDMIFIASSHEPILIRASHRPNFWLFVLCSTVKHRISQYDKTLQLPANQAENWTRDATKINLLAKHMKQLGSTI